MLRLMPRFVLRNQKRKDRGQQHEDEGLHNADQHLHKIKWNRNQPGERRNNRSHRFEHVFTRVNVSEKSKAQRDRPEQDRDELEPADHEENKYHYHFEKPRGLALRTEKMEQETTEAVGLQSPEKPERKKYHGHGGGHVEIRISSAQQRPV